jgi:D-alanyl-D-alanine-carboxypeptidase/D-alanyl-D-alanine-endopeptidase
MTNFRRTPRVHDIASRWVAEGGAEPVDAASGRHSIDAVVELGSVTKTVTGTLLDRMATKGLVDPDEPIECWVEVPAGTGITPRLLAEHRSGLPRLPPGIPMLSSQPYQDFDRTALAAAIARLPSLVKGQGRVRYSNFGYAVLGAALSAAGGQSWYELARQHVLDPLDLAGIVDERPTVGSLAGVDRHGQERQPWVMLSTMAPVGGLWGSVRDVSRYARSLLVEGALGPPSAAWQLDRGVLWHSGGTRDAAVHVAVDPDRKSSVVVHTFGLGPYRTDKLGMALVGSPAGNAVVSP